MPKKNGKKQIVVYQAKQGQQAQRKKSNQPSKRLSNRAFAPSSALLSYASALMRPFSREALGARIPDLYSYPTATYHCQGTVTLSSNAAGIASVALFPDPYCTMIDMTSSSVTSSSMAQYGNSPTVYAGSTLANMQAVLSNFRVVGGGVKVRNLLPPTTATGRIICATVPMADVVPGPATLTNTVMLNGVAGSRATGLILGTSTVTTGLPAGILQFPGAQENTIQNLITGSLDVNFKPITADSAFFRSTNNVTQASSFAGSALVQGYATNLNASTGAVGSAGDTFASTEPTGYDCILLRFEGLPPSTVCADLQYILHYEGTPALLSASGSLAPAIDIIPVVNTQGHAKVLDAALSQPSISIGSALVSGAVGFIKGGPMGAIDAVMAKLGMTL